MLGSFESKSSSESSRRPNKSKKNNKICFRTLPNIFPTPGKILLFHSGTPLSDIVLDVKKTHITQCQVIIFSKLGQYQVNIFILLGHYLGHYNDLVEVINYFLGCGYPVYKTVH